MADESEDVAKIGRKSQNDIKDLTSIKQLDNLQLDLTSPRLKRAAELQGIPLEILKKPLKKDFRDKTVSKDIVELRYKHAQEKLLERINKILRERRRIIRESYRESHMIGN